MDESTEDQELDSFMQGYEQDEDAEECEECGAALDEHKKVVAIIDRETHNFCSNICKQEFEEGL